MTVKLHHCRHSEEHEEDRTSSRDAQHSDGAGGRRITERSEYDQVVHYHSINSNMRDHDSSRQSRKGKLEENKKN